MSEGRGEGASDGAGKYHVVWTVHCKWTLVEGSINPPSVPQNVCGVCYIDHVLFCPLALAISRIRHWFDHLQEVVN